MNLHAFNRVLRTTLLMPIILLGILAGVLVWQIQEALAAQGRVARAGEVIQRLYKLQALIVDEETGLRGYQLTGDKQMLEPYQAGEENAEKQFQALANLLNTPGQKLRLAQVRDQYALWQGYAYPALSAGKQSATAEQVAADLQSKAVMDQLRSRMGETIRMEQQARDELLRAAQRRIHDFLRIVLAAGFAVGVLIGTFTSSRLRRVSRAYEESLQQLKTRNEELYESRQSYLTTLESIGEGVIACDTIGRVRFMNAVAQKLTGWTMEEALEQPLTEVFNAVDEKTRLPIQKLTAPAGSLADGAAAPEEPILLLARDARELVIAKSAAPIRDVTGNALGIVVVFRDITAARNAEQALLSSEKLAITGRLAASIAHEIHNPLDSVANLHFLLRSEQDPAKRDQYLAMAEQELSRTLQISRAMLSLYRESRSPVDVVLPELIDSVLLLLDRKIKQAQIRVERHYQSAGHVRAFPGEIRQVFTNVFANAAEASQEGGVIRVTIMSSSMEDGEPGTVVEVSDTGSGVDPLVEKKLFQPFVTTKGEKGTGLGLWVSLGIVQKHGGTMRITNNTAAFPVINRRKDDQRRADPTPRGACVRIYLPAQYDGGPPNHVADEDTILPTAAETVRAEEAAGAFHFPS